MKFKNILLTVLLGVSFVYFIYNHLNTQSRLSSHTVNRQSLPPPLVLDLPAPLPASPNPPEIHPLTPEKTRETNSPQPQPVIATPRPLPIVPKPGRGQIIEKYRQVVALDTKYYQTAIASDRYGYANQAILYYRKYLFIAPTGSHALQVRQRLLELKPSP